MTVKNTTLLKATEEELQQWLECQLSPQRYHHSKGTQKKAVELARHFCLNPADIEKASLAGLLHDAAKLMTPDELLQACNRYGIAITDEERQSPQTLHPFVGAEMVREQFDIEDTDILNAIRYHTTGRPGMSVLEKVVYVADKIEENTRNPLYTQKITAQITGADLQTLDRVTSYILGSTVTFLVEKNQVIHPRTIAARNELVSQLKQSDNADMGVVNE